MNTRFNDEKNVFLIKYSIGKEIKGIFTGI